MSAPAKSFIDLLSDERGVYGIQYGHKLESVVCMRPDKIDAPILAFDLNVAHSTDRSPLAIGDEDDIFGPLAMRRSSVGFDLPPAFLHNVPKAKRGSDVLETRVINSILQSKLAHVRGANQYRVEKGIVPPSLSKHTPSKEEKAERTKEIRFYHSIRSMMQKTFAGMWKRVLLSADQDALKLARRFPLSLRMLVYRLAASSKRILQALQVCPMIAGYCFEMRGMPADMAEAIERGEKLRPILERHSLPWFFRKLLPSTTFSLTTMGHWENSLKVLMSLEEEIHGHLPKTAMGQLRYVRAVLAAKDKLRHGTYASWVARHAPVHLKVADLQRSVMDLGDWYLDTYGPRDRLQREEWKTPPFAWARGEELSREWHNTMELRRYADACRPFPKPWLPAGEKGKIKIVPLISGLELANEGREMHHCVASYATRVIQGSCYIYSVQEKQKSGYVRLGTLELSCEETGAPMQPDGGPWKFSIRQFRGPCNKDVPRSVHQSVLAWINGEFEEIETPQIAHQMPPIKKLEERLRGDGELDVAEWDVPF